MINLFNNNSDDFQYLLDNLGTDVEINSVQARAVILNTPINQNYDDKKIKTLQSIKRGDKVKYQDNVYLIISEINGTRYGKYKGLMRRTNFVIQIHVGDQKTIVGYDGLGRPEYETTPIYKNEECIIANQTAAINGGQINLPDGNIDMTFQDNETTRKIKLNDTYVFSGDTYKVYGFDKTKVGLLIVKCKRVVE
ncbi:hypothetical protein [Bacillus smithii]|uniref:Uncharacterized protein n=1 Tax=Bacillus smithii 7_3_47FAA TaxID=665952 RepID=G9QIP1_9BACI|nr:hypothetical protein [Bacillus smithii]EHL78992.1 hypothetical protein HMPREF1015_02968 [Bacillus smithii 7_3_47FAA]